LDPTVLHPRHLLGTSPDCDGLGQPERLLGYLQGTRGGEAQRSLHRCRWVTTGVWYHTVDGACFDASGPDAILGYVI
jgi:hypothetical protein